MASKTDWSVVTGFCSISLFVNRCNICTPQLNILQYSKWITDCTGSFLQHIWTYIISLQSSLNIFLPDYHICYLSLIHEVHFRHLIKWMELKYLTNILAIPSLVSMNILCSFFIFPILGLTASLDFTYLKKALLFCLKTLARNFSYNLFACLTFFLKWSALFYISGVSGSF